MTEAYLDHPTEDALERYLLNTVTESELETIETHFMACETCITRLEALGEEVTVIQTALTKLEAEPKKAPKTSSVPSWRSWFTIPNLSLAGAAAALILAVLAAPNFIPAKIDLSAHRGSTVVVVPENRPLALNLQSYDLRDGGTTVEVVNGAGQPVWTGTAMVRKEEAHLSIPRLKDKGIYFIRFYSAAQAGSDRELLQEFQIEVK